MALSNAELLDSVRRLRTYMITMDNVHHVLTQAEGMDDDTVAEMAKTLLVEAPAMNAKVSLLLRTIEATKQYRDMLKTYNLNDEDL